MFVGHGGVNAVKLLDLKVIEKEFGDYFRSGLQSVSDEVSRHSIWFVGFVVFHLFVVVTNVFLCSPKFGSSHMSERWQHLLASFWLPLPYLSRREVDGGEEKHELWFLIALHTFENTALLLVSRWCFLSAFPAYPPALLVVQIAFLAVNMVVAMFSCCKRQLFNGGCFLWFYLLALVLLNVAIILVPKPGLENGFFVIDIVTMTLNTLAVAVSVFYTSSLELYADLPHILHNLPSYGPEVRLTQT